MQHLAVVAFAETVDDALVHVLQDFLAAAAEPVKQLCQEDTLGAAVLRVGPALDQSDRLKLGDVDAGGNLVNAQGICKFRLGLTVLFQQGHDHAVLVAAETTALIIVDGEQFPDLGEQVYEVGRLEKIRIAKVIGARGLNLFRSGGFCCVLLKSFIAI